MVERYKAPIVKKAFQVLHLVSRSAQGAGISELARQLGIGKSTVHGLASALEEAGAVVRDPVTKKYRPGVTLFELGRAAYARIDLKEAARPHMENLMTGTRESVFLGVKNVDHVTILDIVESNQDLKITAPIGTTIPLLAGAIGKLFLADMSDDQIAELLEEKGLPRFTAQSITDPGRYWREIKQARQNRFAVDDEEYISGVRAVAAPINNDGQAPSAIWVVGFKPSMSDAKMQRVVALTKSAAESISRSIGHQRHE